MCQLHQTTSRAQAKSASVGRPKFFTSTNPPSSHRSLIVHDTWASNRKSSASSESIGKNHMMRIELFPAQNEARASNNMAALWSLSGACRWCDWQYFNILSCFIDRIDSLFVVCHSHTIILWGARGSAKFLTGTVCCRWGRPIWPPCSHGWSRTLPKPWPTIA